MCSWYSGWHFTGYAAQKFVQLRKFRHLKMLKHSRWRCCFGFCLSKETGNHLQSLCLCPHLKEQHRSGWDKVFWFLIQSWNSERLPSFLHLPLHYQIQSDAQLLAGGYSPRQTVQPERRLGECFVKSWDRNHLWNALQVASLHTNWVMVGRVDLQELFEVSSNAIGFQAQIWWAHCFLARGCFLYAPGGGHYSHARHRCLQHHKLVSNSTNCACHRLALHCYISKRWNSESVFSSKSWRFHEAMCRLFARRRKLPGQPRENGEIENRFVQKINFAFSPLDFDLKNLKRLTHGV